VARVQKDVVSYFPHDANACTGDTLTVLQSQFGNDGYAFWFKLLEKLSSTEGHFLDCRNSTKWQLLLAKTGVNEITGVDIMKLLVEMKAIDKDLWGSRVIWCQNLVDNVSEVYKNRRREIPQKPVIADGHCVVCGITIVDKHSNAKYCSNKCRQKAARLKKGVTPNYGSNGLTTDSKAITTDSKAITTGESTQSKVKYSKVKKSIYIPYPEYPNINKITREEHQKLIEKFGEAGAKDRVENLSLYIASKGDKYKNHYATILSWENKDKKASRAHASLSSSEELKEGWKK